MKFREFKLKRETQKPNENRVAVSGVNLLPKTASHTIPGNYIEIVAPNKNPVVAVFGIDPPGEVKRGFDEEKLTVGDPYSD